MKTVFNLMLALVLVSGCELVYIPIVMVAIPLVAVGQSVNIKQGFTIVDRTRKRLAGPAPETAPEGKVVQLSGSETVCTGTYDHPKSMFSDSATKSTLSCSDGRKMSGTINADLTGFYNFSIGDKTEDKKSVNRRPADYFCRGNYSPHAGNAVTFVAKCSPRQGQVAGWTAVVSSYPQTGGKMKLAVWIPPKPK
ncbi:MAG: hypothetical protein ACI8R4_002092 [Paracoccaceae bacterium]|jgi:hypothetical protein